MSEPFIAEIKIMGFNFAPRGWALCNGQLMPISQNTALFSLLGTFYGGDGKSTFALPNLMDSSPMHPGQGPGLSLYDLGQTGGTSSVSLLSSEMPFHSHQMLASSNSGGLTSPSGNSFASGARGRPAFYNSGPPNVQMGAGTQPAGSSFPHNNRQPYLGLTFIIALQGIFPQRP